MTSKLKLIWLVPILITIHNLEEAVFMPVVLARRNATVPNALHGLLPAITYRQFLLALLIMTSIPYLIAWFAAREGERLGAGMFWLLCVQAMIAGQRICPCRDGGPDGGLCARACHRYSHQPAFLNIPVNPCRTGKVGCPKDNGIGHCHRTAFARNSSSADINSFRERSESCLTKDEEARARR
jgi:hypothetical protein